MLCTGYLSRVTTTFLTNKEGLSSLVRKQESDCRVSPWVISSGVSRNCLRGPPMPAVPHLSDHARLRELGLSSGSSGPVEHSGQNPWVAFYGQGKADELSFLNG